MQLDHTTTDNPDQRISDDIDRYTSISLALSIGLMNSVVTLFSFLFILWTLSGILSIPLGGGRSFDIPGYMVYRRDPLRGGRHLADASDRRPAGPADSTTSSATRPISVSAWCGCARTPRASRSTAARAASARCSTTALRAIVLNWWDIIRRRKKLTWFTSGYSQVAVVFPFIVAAPRYFSKEIQLGGLMQIASAFGQVQDSLSFIITSYVEIAEYRAVVERLGGFRAKVDEVAAAQRGAAADRDRARRRRRRRWMGSICTCRTGRRCARTSRLPPARLAAADHRPVRRGQEHAVARRRRALAVRQRRVRVGRGARAVPAAAALSAARHAGRRDRSIPRSTPKPGRAEIEAALRAVGLPYLVPLLDEEGNWAQRLSGGEQQRIGFARVLLMRPRDRVSRRGDLGARRGGRGAALPDAARGRVGADHRQRRPPLHIAALP